jgi:hypothetical protein
VSWTHHTSVVQAFAPSPAYARLEYSTFFRSVHIASASSRVFAGQKLSPPCFFTIFLTTSTDSGSALGVAPCSLKNK